MRGDEFSPGVPAVSFSSSAAILHNHTLTSTASDRRSVSMGFSHFYRLTGSASFEELANQTGDHVLVIDFNNFVLTVAVGVGGHRALIETRCASFFRAIRGSGCTVHIVKDGSASEERMAIKLGRTMEELLGSLPDPTRELDTIPSGNSGTIAFQGPTRCSRRRVDTRAA
jgi:hypothetical protein